MEGVLHATSDLPLRHHHPYHDTPTSSSRCIRYLHMLNEVRTILTKCALLYYHL